jgi:hypothetical protein
LVEHPARRALEQRVQDLLQEPEPDVASWFVTDPEGLQLARAPEHDTVGKNFSWRTYFHGGFEDYPEDWRPKPDDHIQKTNLSAVFFSNVNNRWTVTISTPVIKEQPDSEDGKFLGVIGLSVSVHDFVDLQDSKGNRPFAVLVDWRPGPNKGLILQHPLFDQLHEDKQMLDRFANYRVAESPETSEKNQNYVDPMAMHATGKAYDKHWLIQQKGVSIREGNTGWIVIVQESYDAAIGRTLGRLKHALFSSGILAGLFIAGLSAVLWASVLRVLGEPTPRQIKPVNPAEEP